MSAIVVEDLHKSYRRGLFGVGGRVTALAGVSLTVEPGEALGIIGPNGAGKTTLLGCLLGFLRPDRGRITIDGRDPDDLEVRRSLGYMPQRVALERWMCGLDLLRHHHALARQPGARREDECRELLDRVGLAAADGARPLREYSGGMLQRIGLAQAMIGRPRLMFLDEPVSGVDPGGVLLFRRLLGDLAAQGTTLVLNSHQLDEVERICTRVAFVRQGRVEAVEVMDAGAGEARVLRVRLSTTATFSASLADLAATAGARFLGLAAPDARFEVADDAGATRLLASLLASGVPVIEVHPEESRLERLFSAAPGAGGRS